MFIVFKPEPSKHYYVNSSQPNINIIRDFLYKGYKECYFTRRKININNNTFYNNFIM